VARRKEPRIPDHLLDQLLAGAAAKSAFAKNDPHDCEEAWWWRHPQCGDWEGSPPRANRKATQQECSAQAFSGIISEEEQSATLSGA
jgi:hypothetical protein